jgi:hypothetical protein
MGGLAGVTVLIQAISCSPGKISFPPSSFAVNV